MLLYPMVWTWNQVCDYLMLDLKDCKSFLCRIFEIISKFLNNIEGLEHLIVNFTLGAYGDLPDAQEGPCLLYFV